MAEYTLIQSGDADAAENVGALAGTIPVHHIVDGLALSGYDPAAPSIDVDAGKTAHVLETATAEWTEDDGTQRSEQRDHVQLVSHLDGQTLALDDGAVNHVFVDPNWSTDDSPQLVANTTGDAPTDASVKVAEVDTANDTVSSQWRLVAADGTLTFPDEAAASAAAGELPNGTVVYTRSEEIHWSTIAGSLKRMATWSDPDGDGVYQLPSDTDGIDVATVSADTLEATGSITDPEGNTVTSLSDPVRVTEEASTFAESDVIVDLNSCELVGGSIRLAEQRLIDDFESGDLTVERSNYNNWSGDTSFASAQTNVVLSGSFSAELVANDASHSLISNLVSAEQISSFGFDIQITGATSGFEDISVFLVGGGQSFLRVAFSDGDIISPDSKVGNWTNDTHYRVDFKNIDYSNNEAQLVIVDVDAGTEIINQTVPARNSATDVESIRFKINTLSNSDDVTIYFDNVTDRLGKLNGDALVQWDSGSPADIDSWDLATFQRTLDGETVTIDLEDANGNVLKSDISKDADISDIATSTDVQLRANFSRNDTSNNPTIDYLARRFTR